MNQAPKTVAEHRPALFEYAFIGSHKASSTGPSQERATIENTLESLKALAMNEEWGYKNTPNQWTYPILYNYILHTFASPSASTR